MTKHKPSCDTCMHVHSEKDVRSGLLRYECHRWPPDAIPILGPDDNGNPKIAGTLSCFPPVNPAYPCGEYEFTLALPPGATRN